MKKDWEIKKLDDVCELITCGVAARPKYVDNGIPFLSAKNVKEGKVIYEGYNCVSEKTHKELTKHNKPLLGDILYTRVGSYGEAAVIEHDIDFSVFVSLTLIKTNKSVLNNYFLRYYLNSNEVKTLAKSSIASSGVGNLNVGTVRKFPIPIPPLYEQLHIVSFLDDTFVALDQVKENLQHNLQNVTDIYQSELNNIFTKKEDSWINKQLNQISENLDSKRIPITKNVRTSGEYPYYGASGVVDYVGEYIFDDNLLLVSEDGANLLARTYPIAFSISGKTWVNNHAHVLKFENLSNQKFVEYYLNSIKLDDFVSGMAQPKLNQAMLNAIPIPFPPFETQKDILMRLDSLSLQTKKLEDNYQKKLDNLEELKKSILQKVFNGELTMKQTKTFA